VNADRRLVVARSVGLRYRDRQILDGVDLEVVAGARIALTGRSGSGKTTLLLVLAGLLAPSRGEVSWPGLSASATARRAEIGMVFQAPSLMPELTALENVTLPLRISGMTVGSAREGAIEALSRVAASDLADALPAQLSGGQQQRVAVARVLAGGRKLVLADEPTGALDRVHASEVALALRDGVAAAGGALVLATHDLDLAELLDERLSISDGRLFDGTTAR
jgi:ABC-type lipoprotein export system ATPase subunit